MSDSISVIGGADGPTSVFLAGKIGINWLNVFGLVIVVLLLIPNIIYAIKFKNQQNKCTNKAMNIIEQIGRYGCMFLMVFNIGISGLGFNSVTSFLIYIIGNIILMIAYWVVWLLYFIKQKYWKQIALAVIPIFIFLLCGITMRHYLLLIMGIVFGIGHIYVTYKNRL